MIIFLYGPDRHRLLKKKKEIVDVYMARNVTALDFKKFDFERKEDVFGLEGFFKTHSMFATKKLAAVDNCLAREHELMSFLEDLNVAEDPMRTVLLSHHGDLPKKGAFVEYIENGGNIKTQSFSLPTKSTTNSLIKDWLDKTGLSADARTVLALGEYYGNDFGKLEFAMERLLLWKRANSSLHVTAQDLEFFIPETEENIFTFVEALIKKDIEEIYRIIRATTYAKRNVWDILRIFDFELKQLVLVMSGDKKGMGGLSAWVRGKLERITKLTSEREIIAWYNTIASLDARLKRSEIGEDEAFEEIISTPLLFATIS